MRVVILDDEELIVRGLIEMIVRFNLQGVDVVGFCTPLEALADLERNAADIVFVDINMPVMDGIAFMEEARRLNPDSVLVVLSGYQSFNYAQRAIRIGISDYMVKPMDPVDLEKILRRVFEQVHNATPEEYANMTYAGLNKLYFERNKCSKQLQKILKFIDDNLFDNLSLSALGEFSKLHPNYISSLFTKELHIKYMTYIHGIKLKKALELLQDESYSIAAIALKLGYYSERQFYRIFNHFIGITPGQYRENGYKL